MNFCEKSTGMVSTETVLRYRRFPVYDVDAMRAKGFFPVFYNYIQYDSLTEMMVPEGDLIFEDDNQRYRQDFKTEPLSSDAIEQNFKRLKEKAVTKLNEDTSNAILRGFDATVDGEVLHFSYDTFDQGNFTDTVLTTITDKLSSPSTINWNGYRNWTPTDKGELVVLTLTPEAFHSLYDVAQSHKNTIKTEGAQKKEKVNSAADLPSLRQILEEINLNEDELKDAN